VRKRVVIAIFLAGTLGTIVYLLSQPKRGSVEWHKREYCDAVQADGAFERWVDAKAANKLRIFFDHRRNKRLQYHRKELLRLGFLEERTVLLTHITYPEIWERAVWRAMRNWNGLDDFIFLSLDGGSNWMKFVTIKQQAGFLEAAIREADVPESGK
jgi:hypothetical protein